MNETKFCQSCGMPLTNEILGTNADGSTNADYCIYCYKDGAFTGDYTMEEMAEYCSMFVEEYNKHTGQHLTACEYKQKLLKYYPTLKRWNTPADAIPRTEHPMKKVFVDEVNALGISELHISNLYVLSGSFINQPYNVNGNEVRLLNDNATYWGNQVQKSNGRCYGIACCDEYILVSEYGKDGSDPEIVLFKRR
ncbi:MAG: zinc ribbon domain-containing protein [Bacteroidales bacterium]|nr:zinc ribbon domain-containing protein [Bacteroidales bacterium]